MVWGRQYQVQTTIRTDSSHRIGMVLLKKIYYMRSSVVGLLLLRSPTVTTRSHQVMQTESDRLLDRLPSRQQRNRLLHKRAHNPMRMEMPRQPLHDRIAHLSSTRKKNASSMTPCHEHPEPPTTPGPLWNRKWSIHGSTTWTYASCCNKRTIVKFTTSSEGHYAKPSTRE